MDTPDVISGNISVDDRGQLSYVNDFDPSALGIRRFYTVENHQSRFVRAWHAHRREAKYVTVLQGSAIVAAVPIDDWDYPSKDTEVYRTVLSAQAPSVLYIPPGYANGSMSLSPCTKLMYFSTRTLKESMGDDVRYDADYWNPWAVEER
jgi:dTDP-4-dehydrorhamnose 3,5-epimerase-like enzyme